MTVNLTFFLNKMNLGRFVGALPQKFYSTAMFRSSISLSNLYPDSTLKITTPDKPPCDPQKEFNGFIPLDQLDITYSRSSGPGGQNVNKVNTKVEVRFQVNSANWISDEVKNRLSDKFKSRITKEGYILFKSEVTRSQQLNLADCLEKIRKAVRNCSVNEVQISQETQERIRRRLERASKERLAFKRQRSMTKNGRQAPEVEL